MIDELKPVTLPEIPEEAIDRPSKPGRPVTNNSPEAQARRERDRKRREAKRQGKEPPKESPRAKESDPLPAQLSLDEELDALGEQYKEKDPAPKAEQGSKPPSEPAPTVAAKPMVTGFVVLAVVDAVMPSLTAWAFGRLRKRKVDPAKLHLTKEERDSLLPAADAAASYFVDKLHPVALFIGSVAVLSWGKASVLPFEEIPKKKG